MIRIAITAEAFDAISATLPLGSVGYENKVNEKGQRLILVDRRNRQRLSAFAVPFVKPLPAPVWFVAVFIPMVASQILRLHQHDPGGWLFWDYAGRLGGLAVLAAMAWPVAFRGETLRMSWMQVALGVLGIILVDHSLAGWIRTTGNHLFPSTVLGHYPLSTGWLHWFDIVFGLGLDT